MAFIATKEQTRKYWEKYYAKNRAKLNEERRLARKTDPEKFHSRDLAHYYRNKKNRNAYKTEYIRDRKMKDPVFALKEKLRARIRSAIKFRSIVKSGKTLELLGADIGIVCRFIENKFLVGMNWDNFGEWHIDHIKPLAEFNLLLESEQRKAFHYTNLQPLWARDNLKKGKLCG